MPRLSFTGICQVCSGGGGGGGGVDNLLFYKYRKGVKIKQVKMTTRKETESETKTMWVYLFGF